MEDSKGASRTAVLVCQGRAAAHGLLAPDRFADPVAAELLHPDELAVVEQVRADGATGHRSGFEVELVRGCAEVLVPRTLAIDEAVRDAGHRQLVVLGAGLDSRAWRMPELADTTVFEVDHPSSQADKRERVAGLSPTAQAVEFVPVDLRRQALGPALGRVRFDPTTPTTWVWEGVVPYLTETEVERTARQLSDLSAAGSRLVVNYQAPSVVAALGRGLVRVSSRVSGRPNPYAEEPHRSAWTSRALGELLALYGFDVRWDADLLTLAQGVEMAVHHRRSLHNGHVLVAEARA
ncbi:MAG TPA: class I SAM-dependent methyltransferase [Segeticoccus sp.]|uniref:class I SAM-dependent methyltransferase n=1 Tax=Segeticoccus sp. TaxID=2706531 RepID=UPI002D8026C3|nr:class I SAM-dependent methyltransferase [Segeticoccus sp.]HET8600202.1 class I SAM-dependent methyltransferase [Segeticoccus sp.]